MKKVARGALVDPLELSHPVLRLFDGDGSPLLEGVKVFQWWGSTIPEERLQSGAVKVLAELSGEQRSAFVSGVSLWWWSCHDLDHVPGLGLEQLANRSRGLPHSCCKNSPATWHHSEPMKAPSPWVERS